jgi:Flp pilus assembly protein TadD
MVITLPFLLLLWDYWPLERDRGGSRDSGNSLPLRSWTQLLIEKVPLLLLSAASAIITLQAQRSGGAVRSTAQFSFAVRMQSAVYAYSEYLWKMVWPARLAPMYPHPGNSLGAWQVGLSALVLLSLSLLVYGFRAHRYLTVGWLWFLGTLVPVIGLVQVGDAAMADRYAYIPLMGIFVMIAFGAADFAAQKRIGVVWQAIPAAGVLLLLALVTSRQIGYWQSSQDLWTHTLQVTQNNFVAEDNLGGALIAEGRPDEAFPHFEAAALINPRDPMSHNNLGVYLQTHGHTKEAMAQYQSTISLTSDPGLSAQAYANLGAAQRELGEDALAAQNFDKALRVNPNQANAWLGKGLLAEKQGKSSDAINYLWHAIELQPSGESYLALGKSLEQSGRKQEALEAYRQALKIAPGLAEAQHAADALSGREP